MTISTATSITTCNISYVLMSTTSFWKWKPPSRSATWIYYITYFHVFPSFFCFFGVFSGRESIRVFSLSVFNIQLSMCKCRFHIWSYSMGNVVAFFYLHIQYGSWFYGLFFADNKIVGIMGGLLFANIQYGSWFYGLFLRITKLRGILLNFGNCSVPSQLRAKFHVSPPISTVIPCILLAI